MSKFRKELINPIEFIKSNLPNAYTDHIEFDPKMKRSDREYWIIRGGGHDGTQLFTWETLRDAVLPLMQMQSFFKSKEPDSWEGIVGIKYKVGYISLATAYGMVNLRCGRYPGQVERVRIPVRCELVYK